MTRQESDVMQLLRNAAPHSPEGVVEDWPERRAALAERVLASARTVDSEAPADAAVVGLRPRRLRRSLAFAAAAALVAVAGLGLSTGWFGNETSVLPGQNPQPTWMVSPPAEEPNAVPTVPSTEGLAPATAEVLERLARAAADSAGSGWGESQYWYSRTQAYEWVNTAEGGAPVRGYRETAWTSRYGESRRSVEVPDRENVPSGVNTTLAAQIGTLPAPDMPSDPDAVAGWIDAMAEREGGSGDGGRFDAAVRLLSAPVSPGQRAAVVRYLAALPGMRSYAEVKDSQGRQGVLIERLPTERSVTGMSTQGVLLRADDAAPLEVWFTDRLPAPSDAADETGLPSPTSPRVWITILGLGSTNDAPATDSAPIASGASWFGTVPETVTPSGRVRPATTDGFTRADSAVVRAFLAAVSGSHTAASLKPGQYWQSTTILCALVPSGARTGTTPAANSHMPCHLPSMTWTGSDGTGLRLDSQGMTAGGQAKVTPAPVREPVSISSMPATVEEMAAWVDAQVAAEGPITDVTRFSYLVTLLREDLAPRQRAALLEFATRLDGTSVFAGADGTGRPAVILERLPQAGNSADLEVQAVLLRPSDGIPLEFWLSAPPMPRSGEAAKEFDYVPPNAAQSVLVVVEGKVVTNVPDAAPEPEAPQRR